MDQVTQQNAAMVEEATAVMHKLAASAQKLGGMVDQFEVSSRSASASRAQRAA
jgi:methyl-accepting chemotaxis protein